jgi:hypothetical protein
MIQQIKASEERSRAEVTSFEDWVGGREWGQAFLPVVVTAFHVAFGGA